MRVAAAGVCHSDLHFMKGDIPTPLPAVLGHEGAAVVEAVGPGVDALHPGDHCILIFWPNCGRCEYCQVGRPMLCNGHKRVPGAMPDGTTRLSLDGKPVYHMTGTSCFAERAVIHQEQLLKIDESVPLDRAALVGCSVTTGVGAALNTAKVRGGSSVAVIGCGGVGLSIVLGARLQGAGRIVAIDLFPEKLELATTLGATDAVDAHTDDLVKNVKQLTGGGVDYAFDAIGLPVTVRQALDLVRPGGTAVAVGIGRYGEPTPIDALSLVLQEKALLGSFYGSARPRVDMPRILDLYRQGKLQLDALLRRHYPLERINEAYADLQGPEPGRGVITFS
ncbi:MAG TPA: Zn-dependent alcohol dehydrogenase [Candidatus Dormibacteraeota bacterium]